jgi:hypothetical protein
MIDETEQVFDDIDWLIEEHERLRKPDFRYLPLAVVVVILSYLYGITLGVYMCPK